MTTKKVSTGKDRTILIPIVALIAMGIIFSISSSGAFFSPSNLKGLVEQWIPFVMGGLGMVFVIAQGSIDMSFGSNMALCATIGFIVALKYGTWLFFPVSLIVGLGIGLFIGFVVSKLKVSSFMVTIAMLIAMRALVQWMLTDQVYTCTQEFRDMNDFSIKLILTIILIAVIFYLFERTRLGRYSRAIGENEKTVLYSGVNVNKYKCFAFAVSGIFAGLAGCFMLVRSGGTNLNLGNMQELRIFMTMFIGGIPITGGMGTRIYKVLIGAAVIALLENGLAFSGITGFIYEFIEGVILIAVVAITLYMYNKTVHASKAALKEIEAEA